MTRANSQQPASRRDNEVEWTYGIHSRKATRVGKEASRKHSPAALTADNGITGHAFLSPVGAARAGFSPVKFRLSYRRDGNECTLTFNAIDIFHACDKVQWFFRGADEVRRPKEFVSLTLD